MDPITLAAVGVGLAAGLGFVMIAAVVEGPGSRRLARRLQQVKARKSVTGGGRAAAGPVRSLSRRESKTPGMDRLARRWLPRRDALAARLTRTGREITIGQYMAATVILILVLWLLAMFVGGLRFGPALLFATAFGIGVPHYVIGRMGKRRIAAFVKLFPEAIDLMVRALRSGLPISEAIINAGMEIGDPVGVEFRSIEQGMRLGRDLDSLLWDIAKRIDTPEFRFFIIALSVQRETGGNLAETLSNLSDVLRKRRTMRAKARAMASEARASTAILGALPILVTVVLMLTSPGYIMVLFTDVRGLILVGIAVGMLLTGIGIMVKMARFEI